MYHSRAIAAEREALLARASYVEARRQKAREEFDLDAQRHCEQELAILWKQWLQGATPPG
jgi:hypothetical protein